jgi:organic radical activating enzyme
MKKTREQIIESMCSTWRHDYHIVRSPENKFSGMTIQEREFLYSQMAQVFDNVIAKILLELEAKNQNLEEYILKSSINQNYIKQTKTDTFDKNFYEDLSKKISHKIKDANQNFAQVKNSIKCVENVLEFKNNNKKYDNIKEEIDLKNLKVGSRFLYKTHQYLKDLKEDVVEEWSPSKNYIKLKIAGWVDFEQFSKYNILEVLENLEK